MPKIQLLPKNVAELIAAGEVVERPASVIKELVENSIDAGAKKITVEINRGGITYIRVTDDGCGIAYEDVPTAFLRHATSKITKGSDLDAISTLGFRGEALAAVSSVARVEMLTAVRGCDYGASYVIEGGEEVSYCESGCPVGTTIIIRDIFYNTPARMKFLKKDVSEANACAAVVDRIALSHPEISFKFIRDGKQTLSTSGDGNVKSVVYSVLGRDFSLGLIELSGENGKGIKTSGVICKPINCRPTRNNQFTFLNGRLVRSGTVVAAVEQAYKNSAMVGKFPAFVLYLTIPYDTVDVNVHPAKTEVRFSDEKTVFEAVYVAVKNALAVGDTRPEVKLNKIPFNPFVNTEVREYSQERIATETKKPVSLTEEIYKKPYDNSTHNSNKGFTLRSDFHPQIIEDKPKITYVEENQNKPLTMEKEPKKTDFDTVNVVEAKEMVNTDIASEQEDIILVGEAFSTYIIIEKGESIFLIDKHAAHERIIFNRLKKEHKTEVQPLLTPVSVVLTSKEYDGIITNLEILEQGGFEIEDFGSNTVLVRALPTYLTDENISMLISEIAEGLTVSGRISAEREDNLFHTVACKAAIKAGSSTSKAEMLQLAKRVLSDKEVMYCPHGRPVSFEIKKRDMEKQFGRIQ